MYKVTNIDETTQVIYDKGGRRVTIEPGKTEIMEVPPKESYTFHVEKIEEKEELKNKKEVK